MSLIFTAMIFFRPLTVLAGLTLGFFSLLRKGELLYRLGSRLLDWLHRVRLLRNPEPRRKKLQRPKRPLLLRKRAQFLRRRLLLLQKRPLRRKASPRRPRSLRKR